MPTAGSATVTVTSTEIVIDTGGVPAVVLRCLSTSANDALVNVPGVHAVSEFFHVESGEEMVFRSDSDAGIKSIFVKGSGGNTDISYAVVSRG